MIGLDTNVLLPIGDASDAEQAARAIALVRAQGSAGSFVSPIVLSEFAWTLKRRYKLTRAQVADRVEIVLEATEFMVAYHSEARRALERYRAGPADFADYFVAELNITAGCGATFTFDIDALKSGEPFHAVPALI